MWQQNGVYCDHVAMAADGWENGKFRQRWMRTASKKEGSIPNAAYFVCFVFLAFGDCDCNKKHTQRNIMASRA